MTPRSSGFEVVAARSGLPAMRDRATGEVMHPGTGPDVEARVLYVEPSRLEHRLREPSSLHELGDLVLYDVGLGAASNAIAAWNVAEGLASPARRLRIVSFEQDLGALELALAPNHAESFGLVGPAETAARAILSHGHYETERATWSLALGDFRDAIAKERDATCDIVFWDFYSQKADPSLWSVATLTALRRTCRLGMTLHTYCAATSFRAALLLAGFAVGIGSGTGARSETTVAALDHRDLVHPLGARWLTRLERSHAAFPVDVPRETWSSALASIHGAAQFR